MTAPLTGLETRGDWSTLAEETLLLNELAGLGLTVNVMGLSVSGNPVRRCSLGNATGPTMFIQAGVHGNEPSARETALTLLRDLVCQPSPSQTAWLATNNLVVVPNANPDGSIPPRTRNNAAGVNINRDYMQLTQPESKAVAAAFHQKRPLLSVDLHEMNPKATDFMYSVSDTVGMHSGLPALTTAMKNQVVSAVSSGGWSNGPYTTLGQWGTFSGYAGRHHAASFLSEVGMHLEYVDRVTLTLTVVAEAMAFFDANSGVLQSAQTLSIVDSETSLAGVLLPSGDSIPPGNPAVEPGSYPAPNHLAVLYALQGIEVVDGVASTQQAARAFVVALLDPASTQYVVDSPYWVERATAGVERRSDGWWVTLPGGVRHPVKEIWVVEGGERRKIDTAWSLESGVRVRVR